MASVNSSRRRSWDGGRLKSMPCWSRNPLRSAVVRTICALSAWLLVVAVGVVLYRNSLESKRQQRSNARTAERYDYHLYLRSVLLKGL